MNYWLLAAYVLVGGLWLIWMARCRNHYNWQLVTAFTVFLPHTLAWTVSLLIALGVVKLFHWLLKEA